jgi:hypothetical protein
VVIEGAELFLPLEAPAAPVTRGGLISIVRLSGELFHRTGTIP